ncbi:hypothetical protein LBMAG48_08200 [Phycisphaerae bacterium]|nr:hypothetical protein LBMAG48_08200 [Phycisphaerae bacterium]
MKHCVSVAGLIAACCVTSGAFAQADVTLADPNDVSNYGLVGNIRGYAWGSRTCNIGNQVLLWQNNGTPGLAMNLHRIHNGRFQQVGWSFVKLACCAASSQFAACGTCQGGGGGLGIGCLDTYSSGWNGGQSRLGPRSAMNASTGAFQAHNPPAGTTNAIFRRLQVLDSDVNTTAAGNFQGARYISEGVYVASDESASGRMNNATYRPLNMTDATNRTFALTGTPVIGTPAIQSWRDHGLGLNVPDTSVTISQIDVPGTGAAAEGRFWYGFKARDLGNGRWLYDYAVFNLNSDRSGGSLEIPIPCGVTVTNAGFSSPWYHSGEVYNSDPWAVSISSNSIKWETAQKFSTNVNANAIRWGSTFSFWFEASTPPATNQLGMLGLFKPQAGGVASVALTLTAPGPRTNVACDGIDFNRNSVFPEDQDVIDFFNVLAGGPCPYSGVCDIDFNNNCIFPEDRDVTAFFDVLAGATCQ